MSFSIDRRAGLSRRQFEREYSTKHLPVILADATAHWPARQKWDLEFFRSRFGSKTVDFNGASWRMEELVDRLRSGPVDGFSPYLSMVKVEVQFAELSEDIGRLAVASCNRLNSRLLPSNMKLVGGNVAVFVGAKGSGFGLLHWDGTKLNVFVSQIHGDKHFIVFRPDDSPYLYSREGLNDDNKSRIPDPFNVDLEEFPEFAKATPVFVTVKQGETLFLPAGWWHATRIEEPSIAIAESALDRGNWAERIRWYQRHYRSKSTPFLKRYVLRHALSAYLACVDVALRVKERWS